MLQHVLRCSIIAAGTATGPTIAIVALRRHYRAMTPAVTCAMMLDDQFAALNCCRHGNVRANVRACERANVRACEKILLSPYWITTDRSVV